MTRARGPHVDDGSNRPAEVDGHHRHNPRRLHTLSRRGGVPYEVERIVCTRCAETLAERPLRRAEA